MSKNKEKGRGSGYVAATLLSILWLGVNYYIYYPAINLQNPEFWTWLLFHSVIISCIFIFSGIISRSRKVSLKKGFRSNLEYFRRGTGKIQLILLVVIPVFCDDNQCHYF